MRKGQIFLYSLAFVIQIYKAWNSYCRMRKYKKLIQILKRLKPISPSQMIQKMQKSKLKSSYQLCKGIVSPAEQLYSFLKPSLSILSSHLFEGNFMASNGGPKRILNKRQPSHYVMKDGQNNIKIYEIHKIIHDYTTIIKKVQIPFLQKIRNFIDSIVSPKQPISITSQLFGGDNIYQVYLPCEKEYTVFANFTNKNGEIFTDKPIIMADNPYNIGSYFKNMVIKNSLIMSSVLIGALICLSLVSYQLWSHYRKSKNEQRQPSGEDVKTIIVKSRVCSICNNKLSCIFNKPCSHMPTCKECRPRQSNCCQCSSQINEEIQYFVC